MEEFIQRLELNLLLKLSLSGAKFKVYNFFRTENILKLSLIYNFHICKPCHVMPALIFQ